MAQRFFLGQAAVAATPLTATGNSAVINNSNHDGQVSQSFSNIDVAIEITAAPTGTTPTLTGQLYVSLDGVTFEPFGSATSSQNAAGALTLSNTGCDFPFMYIHWVLGGTTPSFPVTANVYGF